MFIGITEKSIVKIPGALLTFGRFLIKRVIESGTLYYNVRARIVRVLKTCGF